jgi:hypothetical protein
VTTVITVGLTTLNAEAAVSPNETADAPVKLVPVMVTKSPPSEVPEDGATEAIVGAGSLKENPLANTAVPPLVSTETATRPRGRAGVTAVMVVALSTVNDAAAVPPNDTEVAPDRLVPVRVTLVPPRIVPESGLAEVRVGATPTGAT